MLEKGPILVWPGLIEARNEKWITDYEKQDYLLSPLSYYTLRYKKAILLPWLPHKLELETFLSKHNAEFFKEKDEIWLIVRNWLYINKEQKQKKCFIQEVLEDWLRSQGFLLFEKKSFGMIIVTRFVYSSNS